MQQSGLSTAHPAALNSPALQRLGRFPESGRIGRVAGTRELVIVRTPYIAAYQVGSVAVLVLRILHGSQQWPGDF